MKNEKDLVWLFWPGCSSFPILTEETPKDVAVDVATESWTFRGQTIKFGRAVEYPWGRDTALGAYDRTNSNHLQQMLVDYRRLAPPLSVSAS